ncbi:hypothetical protein H8693_00640 [Christensenellaceae bacterium NSJ-63]|uniref:Uncharacterized protein n=1 Tax=Guopingia tenuis TaxID=2763656 RepID=A0A926HUZ7_9FIRM|nr:hypothetical protein [Guopingia tenuis]
MDCKFLILNYPSIEKPTDDTALQSIRQCDLFFRKKSPAADNLNRFLQLFFGGRDNLLFLSLRRSGKNRNIVFRHDNFLDTPILKSLSFTQLPQRLLRVANVIAAVHNKIAASIAGKTAAVNKFFKNLRNLPGIRRADKHIGRVGVKIPGFIFFYQRVGRNQAVIQLLRSEFCQVSAVSCTRKINNHPRFSYIRHFFFIHTTGRTFIISQAPGIFLAGSMTVHPPHPLYPRKLLHFPIFTHSIPAMNWRGLSKCKAAT